MIYGLDFIATLLPTVPLTASIFEAEPAPLVFGWIYASHFLSAGLMALAAGEMRDMLTSYLPAFFAAGLLCLVAVPPLTLLGEQTGMRLWHILHLKRQT